MKKEETQKIIEDYTNMLKRLQADFENYVKRAEKEKQEFVNYSNHKLIAKLLNIVDDFEKALDIINNNGGEVADGVEMIYNQFFKVLEDEGVKPIESVGQKLDPFKHDVIDITTGKEDVVIEELQRGYMLKDKVLRAAKVRISKSEVKENV